VDSHSAVSVNTAPSPSTVAGMSNAVGDSAPHPKWEWATSRIRQRRDLCDQRAQTHDARAAFWQRWAAPLAWATAVLAALSALSVVANMSVVAAPLSILAAIMAATVAAFHPSEAAKLHRAAATAYERLARKLEDVEALHLGDSKQQIPPEKIDPVRTEITTLEEELISIELSHPPVSTFKRPMYVGAPHSYMSDRHASYVGDDHLPRRAGNSR
jgi:hypothetical protein